MICVVLVKRLSIKYKNKAFIYCIYFERIAFVIFGFVNYFVYLFDIIFNEGLPSKFSPFIFMARGNDGIAFYGYGREILSYLSEGNLNQANKLLQVSDTDELNHLMLWMRNCYSENYVELQKDIDWFNLSTKIKKRAFLTYTMKLMREALISKIDSNLLKIIDSEKAFISKFQKTLDSDSLERIIMEIDNAIRDLDRNANPKILFLDLSLEISNLFQKVNN